MSFCSLRTFYMFVCSFTVHVLLLVAVLSNELLSRLHCRLDYQHGFVVTIPEFTRTVISCGVEVVCRKAIISHSVSQSNHIVEIVLLGGVAAERTATQLSYKVSCIICLAEPKQQKPQITKTFVSKSVCSRV